MHVEETDLFWEFDGNILDNTRAQHKDVYNKLLELLHIKKVNLRTPAF